MNALRERLAALEHDQWTHWTRYMLANLTPENIERWTRQIETPYSELSEKEKDSDREWADKVMSLIQARYKRLSQIALDVLVYLTDTVEANKWQVSRDTGRSYSSVYKVMDELEEGRFIRVTRTGVSSKNRDIKVKFYGITKAGAASSQSEDPPC